MSIKRFHNFFKNQFDFEKYISKSKNLKELVFQNLDFVNHPVNWEEFTFDNTIFLACDLSIDDYAYLTRNQGVFIYPKIDKLPYASNRNSLYTWQELMSITDSGKSIDMGIYEHFNKVRFNPSVKEALAQRIHDYSIDIGLRELLMFDEQGMTKKKCIGFMGGHSTKRNSKFYRRVAITAKLVSENGFYVVSGGGPGIMEAANFGAYMAEYSEKDFYNALNILCDLNIVDENSPEYTAPNYKDQALKVLEKYPNGCENLAIPTWFYGHEPSNLFASQIAKYFSNSIREDILLAICHYGVVYAPGSAGTTQEIFQEATQNHYGTNGYYSPMIFLGKERYVEETTLYSTLHQLANGQIYKKLLHLADSPKEILEFIIENPPIKKQ